MDPDAHGQQTRDVVRRLEAEAAADARDPDGLAALYTADWHMSGASDVRPGAAFRDDRKVLDAEGTLKRQTTVSPVIDGDRSAVRARLLVFEGEQAPAVTTRVPQDDLRKEGGQWKIAGHEAPSDPGMTINVGQKSCPGGPR